MNATYFILAAYGLVALSMVIMFYLLVHHNKQLQKLYQSSLERDEL